VIGEPDPTVRAQLAADAVIRDANPVRVVAEEMHIGDVELSGSGTRFLLRGLGDERLIETPLIGRHQAQNFAFTLALLDAAGEPFRVSLAEAQEHASAIRLPGRFQRTGRWIFDVAHNADGARTLAASLSSIDVARPVSALVCVLGDKDWRTMIDAIASSVDHFVLTNAPTAPASRSWNLPEAVAYAAARGYSVEGTDDFDDAIQRAVRSGSTTLVTGSFHTVGDTMFRLQVSPLTG
jgi:dihydrofolate synthase/folylpolyglutamate synthase